MSTNSLQNNGNIVAIVQARMGSSRLPGKVLMDIDEMPLLEIMLSRVEKSRLLKKIIIATSNLPKDNPIEQFCINNDYHCFRGSENDVLSRYYESAKEYNADIIVRLTADCPLIDPEIIDKVINLYFHDKVDYSANTVPPKNSTFPDGSDVEVFSYKALERAYKESKKASEREHVTHYFWRGNNGFSTSQLINETNWSEYRFTIDYPEDFKVVEFIIRELKQKNKFGYLKEIIDIIETNPDIKEKNSKYYFGIGWRENNE